MFKIKTILIFAISFLTVLHAIGQGTITIDEDPAITRLMEKYLAQNQEITVVKGFRIQIFSTTDRVKIQQKAGSFAFRFPDIKADWINEKPYYKLRAGAFESKLDCIYVLKQIQEHFPGAYIVVDNRIPIAEVRNL